MSTNAKSSELTLVAKLVKQLARGLGFDVVGIAPASPSRHADLMRRWLADGKAGEMTYLADRIEERLDPAKYLAGARSMICVAMNYHFPLKPTASPAPGRIARYALGSDYHEFIKPKLYAIADWLRETVPGALTKCGVDTAPIAEREFAARAGIGWVGKNTCVLNEKVGSWLFLGSVLTTVELPCDEPAVDRCGSCTRCIDACPTAAITSPYQLDATRCISYLTIEHSGEIDPSLRPLMGDWLYGCDICQDVCPYNSRAPDAELPELRPRIGSGALDVREVLGWKKGDFDRTFRGSAVKRIRLPQLQRNASIILENQRKLAADERR